MLRTSKLPLGVHVLFYCSVRALVALPGGSEALLLRLPLPICTNASQIIHVTFGSYPA